MGVAPSQAPNGRWIDPHNARTVYHRLILRAPADLAAALHNEFAALGLTVEALPELIAPSRLQPTDARLQSATREMASLIVAKCTDGRRVKLGAQPGQLAAVAKVSW